MEQDRSSSKTSIRRSFIRSLSGKGIRRLDSPAVVLQPGQALELTDIKLRISVVETTVVALTAQQLATHRLR